MRRKQLSIDGQQEQLAESQHTVANASAKLESLAKLLQSQSESAGGDDELHGLGMILAQLSIELHDVQRNLDIVNFKFSAKAKN